jgi:hypothetical protein
MILCAWLAGCGDVAGFAEPPPERTAWADVQAEGYGVAGDIVFADGLRVGARVFAAAPLGRTMQVQFPVTGLAAGTELAVGVRAPRAAGRQVIAGQSRRVVGSAEDPRDRWAAAVVDGAVATATVELADGWHPQHAVVVLAVTRGGEIVPAISGPRMDRGAGVLRGRAGRDAADAGDGDRGDAGDRRGARRRGVARAGGRAAGAEPRRRAGSGGAGDRRGGGSRWRRGAARGCGSRGTRSSCTARRACPTRTCGPTTSAQDDPLYKQEAFELFVAGSGEGTRYLEFQVSARGVTFDAMFATHRKGDEGWDSSWRTAVKIAGTLEPGDRDRGWTTEVAVPWAELCEHTAIVCPPRPGMRVRVNAFRLERPDRKRTSALALSPTRVPDFHAWANAAELELQ